MPVLNHAVKMPCQHCGTPTGEPDQYCCGACRVLADLHWQPHPDDQRLLHWQAYDSPDLRAEYNLSSSPDLLRLHFFVEGLECSSCVHLLEKLPEYDPLIRSARVNFGDSELFVEAVADAQPGRIAALVESLGYHPRFLRPRESAEILQDEQDRDFLRRLAVAGACAGNIMLLSVGVYGGAPAPWAQFLHALSILLFLPILFYSAVPFYRGAWSALKARRINVDLPLVIAFCGGFIASVVNLYHANDGIYLDSTAGFLFLILVSRWFLRRSHRRWLSPGSRRPWSTEMVRCLGPEGAHPRSSRQLNPGDLYELDPEQSLPVDSRLESPTALLDVSMMTGEAFPRVFQQGQKIFAGFRVLERKFRARALCRIEDSEISRLMTRIERDSFFKSQKADLFDRSARLLLLAVLGLGLLLIIFAPIFGLDLHASFQRALSLWIVACPCALAFGGPLAYGAGLREATEKGIFIKSADVFDRLEGIRRIVFDKTGTLTEGKLRLVAQEPADIPEQWKQLILSLESQSQHPVAHAFREAWRDQAENPLPLSDVHEIIGSRVFGVYEGQVFGVKSGDPEAAHLEVLFCQDQKILARFHFSDILRADTPAVLQALEQHFQLQLLSGDSQARVDSIATQLKLPPHQCLGRQSPSEKADFLRQSPGSMMIGDGANDAPALAAADVGIAVSGALEESFRRADVYFSRKGLAPLLDLLAIGQKTRRRVWRSLAFALCYNVVAGAAAVLGWVNPLVAALLMPISSLLIIVANSRRIQ